MAQYIQHTIYTGQQHDNRKEVVSESVVKNFLSPETLEFFRSIGGTEEVTRTPGRIVSVSTSPDRLTVRTTTFTRITSRTVYALWNGGASYAPAYASEAEVFQSRAEAVEVFRSRLENHDGSTPCVGNDSEMWLYYADPAEMDDPYPSAIVGVGPRGGIVVKPA